MKIRQILFNLVPGIILFAIPAWLVYRSGSIDIGWSLREPYLWLPVTLGLALSLAGVGLMVWTGWLFWTKGKGSVIPLDPTQKLVVTGPYRYVRNPMYCGAFAVLFGEAILLGSIAVLVFSLVMPLAPLVYVPLKEEPDLAARFGSEYQVYKAHVPRWLPRLKAWKGVEG
jgi:protein-S-isoprenylcysteine O-methyltransferase Ste14